MAAWFLICLRQGGGAQEMVSGYHRRSPVGEAISSDALKVSSSYLVLLAGRCRQGALSIHLLEEDFWTRALLIHEQTPKSLNYAESLGK